MDELCRLPRGPQHRYAVLDSEVEKLPRHLQALGNYDARKLLREDPRDSVGDLRLVERFEIEKLCLADYLNALVEEVLHESGQRECRPVNILTRDLYRSLEVFRKRLEIELLRDILEELLNRIFLWHWLPPYREP